MKFYTLPPVEVSYGYILMNANRPSAGLKYIKSHLKVVKSVIIDSGIEIFRNPNVRDYPEGHIHRLVLLYDRVRRLVPEVYVTCPDYCDDYNPGSLWVSDRVTNIERTLLNVEECVSRYPNVNWLIPIQGHYRSPNSVIKCIKYYDEWGIVDKYDYFAIANLCTERRHDVIIQTIKTVRFYLYDKKIHVFGLDLDVALKVKDIIYSFDSMAWTFPRRRGKSSCRNKKERIEYFKEFIARLAL